MKRYMLFGYYNYYPEGGMNDFKGYFDSINQMYDHILHSDYVEDHYHAYDTKLAATVDIRSPKGN